MKKCLKVFKKIGLTLVSFGLALSSTVALAEECCPAPALVATCGGLRVCNPANDSYWFMLGGRLDFDEVLFSGRHRERGNNYPSGGNIRRALVKFTGGVGDFITFNLTPNFAASGTGNLLGSGSIVNFDDAWVNYSGLWECTNLRFGQFTPLATIDGWGPFGTNNDNMLLEPALETLAFSVPTKGLGIWFDAAIMDMLTVGVVAYQPQQNPNPLFTTSMPSPNNYENPFRSDRWGGAARFTFSPVHDECTVYHLGVLGRFQSMNHVNNFGVLIPQRHLFRVIPEAQARYTNTLVTTGPILARSYNVVSVDALALWGPFTAEAEWSQASVQRFPRVAVAQDFGNVRFHGWHAQAGYMLTGESRRYCFPTGTLHNPRPMSPCGAWEIVARYSTVNMVDKNVNGGSEHNATFGINWFVNEHVRIAANYIRANIRQANVATIADTQAAVTVLDTVAPVATTTPVKRRLDIFGLRFHVVF